MIGIFDWQPANPNNSNIFLTKELKGFDLSALCLRRAESTDYEFLFALFTEDDRINPGAWGLGLEEQQSLAKHQFEAEQDNYKKNFPGVEFLIVEWGSRPVGRLILHETDSEIHLVDLLIEQSWRGHGIGTDVLVFYQTMAEGKEKILRLRVAHENPARHLYERLGFQKTGDDGAYFSMEWRAALSRIPSF